MGRPNHAELLDPGRQWYRPRHRRTRPLRRLHDLHRRLVKYAVSERLPNTSCLWPLTSYLSPRTSYVVPRKEGSPLAEGVRELVLEAHQL